MACKRQQWQVNKSKTRVSSVSKPTEQATVVPAPAKTWGQTSSKKRFQETTAYVAAPQQRAVRSAAARKSKVDSINRPNTPEELRALAPRTTLVCPTNPTEQVGWELTPSEKRADETCAYVAAITVCRRKLGTKKVAPSDTMGAFSDGFNQGFA